MVTDSPLFTREYPFQGHFLDLDGLKLHFLDEGQGDPLLMLHGNPSWSLYYRHLVRELRSDYRVIVPDHIGCGLSDKPADSGYSYRLGQRLDDLDRLIKSLKLERKITLIVHDWGGMIGMAWAVRNPHRIASLILLNTAAFPLPESKKLPWTLRLCRDTQLGAFLIQGFNAFARGAAWIGCKKNKMSAQLRQLYCSPYDSWQNRIATLRFVQDIPLSLEDPSYDLVRATAAGLNQFSTHPVCLCWGEKDFIFDRHFLERWREIYPRAEIYSFPDCGHYILEDARDDVVTIIRDFLSRQNQTAV